MHGGISPCTRTNAYALTFSYASDGPEDSADATANDLGPWSTVTGMTLGNLEQPGTSLSLPASFGSSTMTVSAPEGQTTYRMDGARVTGITRPGSGAEDVTVGYAGARVSSVATAAGSWSYSAVMLARSGP